MPKEFSRSQRVSSQIQRELASILQSEVKDPRLGFVTISEVKVSRDLAIAKVYFTVLNADTRGIEDNLAILTHSMPYVRRELAKRLRLRNCPELRYVYDDSVDRGIRLDKLMSDLDGKPDAGAEYKGH